MILSASVCYPIEKQFRKETKIMVKNVKCCTALTKPNSISVLHHYIDNFLHLFIFISKTTPKVQNSDSDAESRKMFNNIDLLVF